MLIALGVYDALQALGLRISADVSVVAHDDHLPGATAESLFPALTATSAPLKESWGPMASLLVQALDGQPIETLQKMGGIAFFDRASCGASLGRHLYLPPKFLLTQGRCHTHISETFSMPRLQPMRRSKEGSCAAGQHNGRKS